MNYTPTSLLAPTPDNLHRWIVDNLGLDIPQVPVCPHHQAPFDYILASYQESSDLLVWAPRGGGKTTLGALATLLDMLFKPTCQIRILGGSLDQSCRMWEQLLPMVESLAAQEIDGKIRSGHIKFKNKSAVSILAQSQRSVRGHRVQKLRCDEVDLFDPQIWQAAQLVTRSRSTDETARLTDGREHSPIRATIEAFSTMHQPYGLMHNIVEQAPAAGRQIIQWCLLDVLERCTRPSCALCALEPECAGKARHASGFIRVDDAIRMKQRVSRETWEAEMLCLRPSRANVVFPTFNESLHVNEQDFWPDQHAPCARTLAVDFGFSHPFVCLWILSDTLGQTYVLDEYIATRRTTTENAQTIKLRHPGFLNVSCDPAGNHQNAQTAISDVHILRAAGLFVRHRPSRIQDGLEQIRTALAPAAGQPTLRIHPRCAQLIRSMRQYHYADSNPNENPLKDDINDHCIDALRYYYINRHLGRIAATML